MPKKKEPLFYLVPEDEEHQLAERMADILAQEKELHEEYEIYQKKLTQLLLAKGIKRAEGNGFSLIVKEKYSGYDWERIRSEIPELIYYRATFPMASPKVVVYPKKKK